MPLLEDLQLSVRARNALHRLGCETVEDVCGLNFHASLRQLGDKTRSEILDKLAQAGLRPGHHPSMPAQANLAEIRRIARGLDRVQSRIDATCDSVRREIRMLQDRLNKMA
jgi:hypothetical protein